MTQRFWIRSLILGLSACGLPGCLFSDGRDATTAAKDGAAPPGGLVVETPSAYHAHQPAPAPIPKDPPAVEPVEQAHFPAVPTPGGSAPSVKIDEPPPVAPDPPVMKVEKAPEPPLVSALRDLLANRSATALEDLQAFDGASRDLLMTLLPLAARISDGGLDHATPQETAVLLEQLRQLEAVLRPRAALTLDKVCLCRKINGFGDCEPWPEDHAFQAKGDDRRGDRMQVYVEVRNFTCRPCDAGFETSLAGVVEIRDFNQKIVSRIDFPACVDRSQTPRQDYFINFQFHLPCQPEGRCMPEGRYTLRVLVKDVLAPTASDASPRSASRSLDFLVGRPGRD
jgi:hypothetical protein